MHTLKVLKYYYYLHTHLIYLSTLSTIKTRTNTNLNFFTFLFLLFFPSLSHLLPSFSFFPYLPLTTPPLPFLT
jgi:hypothetical protein